MAPLFARAAAFFQRHPVLLLLALTPGIPEYLSGSTKTSLLVLDPPAFLLFLALNLGLYGPGVLLVRESWVRGGRSWGALLLFGIAYALLEEGTALSTLFNPSPGVVASLGVYGRAGGVNWLWTVGVIGFHIVFSVGLPIVLFGLALPTWRGRPLLARPGIAIAAAVFVADIGVLAASEHYYTVQPAWILGAAVVAGVLWVVALRRPAGWLDPPGELPTGGPRFYGALGFVVFPVLILLPSFGEAVGLPAAATIAIDLGFGLGLFLAVRGTVGRRANEAALVALAFGATLPLVGWGLASQISVPVVLAFDVLWALFFYALWDRYRPRTALTSVPSGSPI